jgi:acyl-CoA thioester hydrolase
LYNDPRAFSNEVPDRAPAGGSATRHLTGVNRCGTTLRMYSEQITPRFGDIDGLRQVNNTVIPGWFEQARNPIYRVFNPDFAFDGWNLILARYEIDFVRPLVINGEVTVRTWISKVGTSSFEVSQQALQGAALCTRGTTVLVHYDFGTARPVPIPGAIRERLREHEAGAHEGAAR